MKPLACLPVLAVVLTTPARADERWVASSAASAGTSVLRAVRTATRAATAEPVRAGFLDAGQVYTFSENALFRGYAAPGRITDIMLEPGEVLGAVAAGDTVRWIIGDTVSGEGPARRAHVLVKPAAPGLSTSLVITTDRRSYHLAFTSTAAIALTAISWTYPQGGLVAVRKPMAVQQQAAAVASSFDPAHLAFDYVMSGDTPAWRPLRIFDDGRQTFIEFPASLASGEAPPLFVLGPGGTPDLVNYRQRGRYYIVDRLFDTAELRMGIRPRLVVRITRGKPDGARAAS